MATVVLAWEYERNTSFLKNFFYLQKELLKHNHDAYLVGVNLPNLPSFDAPFLQAPSAPTPILHKSKKLNKIGGFADRLALLGFNHSKTLYCLTKCWEHLFNLLKPQLLIADCAPVACLAAYEKIPLVQVTDGFSLPPVNLPDFPRLRPDTAPLTTTQAMLENMHQVQQRRNKASPANFDALLKSEDAFIAHLPLFDPYLLFRSKEQKFGVFNEFSKPITTQIQEPYFFAYLEMTYPNIEEIIIGLTELEIPGIFFIPDIPQPLRLFLESRHMQILDDIEALLPTIASSSYLIHHGNTVVAEAGLSAGIVQFTLPYNFETEWISNKLKELRVGLTIYPTLNPIQTIKDILNEEWKKLSFKEWVDLRAEHEQQKNTPNISEQVLATCLSLLT
ncbi:Uncharacterised protein [Legionella beliardensis]|uniref:Glycosyltransferase n=1 Tax=Legionella beliardensis TaxID=91822 RepID=A0A378HZ32_9GAMM|nr:hypothetical protein [Legionella beliardensis]STX28167.1 Uncharacterised protein [Legionella beliardensis]